jgi:hypothetical protein
MGKTVHPIGLSQWGTRVGTCALDNMMLVVTSLSVSAHQAPDLAGSPLKSRFHCTPASLSPFFECGQVSVFLIMQTARFACQLCPSLAHDSGIIGEQELPSSFPTPTGHSGFKCLETESLLSAPFPASIPPGPLLWCLSLTINKLCYLTYYICISYEDASMPHTRIQKSSDQRLHVPATLPY